MAPIAAGQTAGEVAAAYAVSVRTGRKWVARFRADGLAALSNLAGAPARLAGRLAQEVVALIVHRRRTLRMSGAAIAATLGFARSTAARWLGREGGGLLQHLDPSQPVRRKQRARPGEPIHPDTEKPGRFDQPRHRVTGTRTGNRTGTRTGCRNRGAGWDVVHVAVDDAARTACVEVPGDERRHTAAGFLLRAPVPQPGHQDPVLTDNGSAYRFRRLARVLRLLGIRHIFTRPGTPKTNHKAERFIQTLLRDWACGLVHPSSAARNTDLPRWIDWFDRAGPHSALNGLPPRQRVNDLMRTRNQRRDVRPPRNAGARP